MIVSLIAAVSENGVIGKNRGMPWHLPADLRYFYQITKGHHVVMGHRTFHEFGVSKPLVNRTNIILSSQKNLQIKGCIVVNSIEDAIEYAEKHFETELFIIGGGHIYRQCMELADRLYITLIHTLIDEGDTFFPEIDKTIWRLKSAEFHPNDDENQYDFTFQVFEKER